MNIRNRAKAYRAVAICLLIGLCLTGLSLMLAHPPIVKAATTYTVNSGADAGGTCPGATCTLRQAIATAASGDTINFAAGLTTITLTSGELLINKRLTINGPGANLLTVRRSAAPETPQFRILDIDSSGSFIFGLSITNGNTGGNGAGLFINPGAFISIEACAVSGNSVNAGGDGAGAFISSNGGLTIFLSTISGNTASSPDGSSGGGIFSNGNLSISNSTISDNNTSDAGGGIFANSGSLGFSSSTVAGNNASDSGGVFSNGISVQLFNTIVAKNTAFSRPDFSGTIASNGYNLIGNTSGTSITGTTTENQLNVDPLLGPLQDNGGPTLTRALLSGSPAIDKGQGNSGVDQRFYLRVADFPNIPNAAGADGTDIGAFEVQLPGTVVFGTTGSWNGGPSERNAGIGFQSSGGTLNIDYIGLQDNASVIANPTTFGGMGQFVVRTTGTGASIAPGTTFALTINQSSPSPGSGTLTSTINGVIQQDASTGLISFSSTSTTIGGVTYTLMRSPIPLVPRVTNGGMTTIQAQISIGSSRPDESIESASRPTESAVMRNELVAVNHPTVTPVTFGTNGQWNNGPNVQHTAITFGTNPNTLTITFHGITQGTTTVNPNPTTYAGLGQFVVSTTGTGATIPAGTTFNLWIASGGLDTIGSTVAGVVSQNSNTGLISFSATTITSFPPVTYSLLQSPIPLVAPSTGGVTTIQGEIRVADATPTPTPTPGPTPMTIQFSASNYPVSEGTQAVDVNITRSGNTTGAAAVDFTTSDLAGAQNCNVVNGVASSRCDYETNIRTVQFAAGETSKIVSVFIINDSYLEGFETFNVSLTNASGASLGAQSNSTVTITDNENANTANPIDAADFFVRLHYLDFLNRQPDSSGSDFWTNQITSCGTDPQCLSIKRVNVSAAFYLSIEFQETGYLIERVYKVSYGNATGTSTLGGSHQLPVPVVRLNEFLPDTQRIGQGVVVGQSGWEQVLEANKQAFCAEFVQRSRFATAFPTTMTPGQFVDALFANAAVTPTASERQSAVDEFNGAGTSANVAARGKVVRRVAENGTLSHLESNRAFVLMQFFGYLRRNPNDPQDTDYTGYDFWLTKLNQFNGNFQNAEMVKAFITSGEYRQRFGP